MERHQPYQNENPYSRSGRKVVDEIVIQDSQTFDAIIAPATGTRLRNIAQALGRKCAKYLEKRVSG